MDFGNRFAQLNVFHGMMNTIPEELNAEGYEFILFK
jgi:hypothetical protein